jgi:hypothetical protein
MDGAEVLILAVLAALRSNHAGRRRISLPARAMTRRLVSVTTQGFAG